MPIKVGLTGGIGSGKTTVARIFMVLGIPVLFADQVSKSLLAEDPAVIQKIKDEFGSETYKNGIPDRAYIASIVFNDAGKLVLLNSIIHPATLAFADRWMANQSSPYAMKEAALIFEAKAEKHLDYIIGVTAPEELRIRRTMKRDNVTKESVLSRMQSQMDDQEKMKRCDFVIYNDERQLLIPQVLKIDQLLRKNQKLTVSF